MDPQSQSFTPYSSNNDTWRLQTDVVRIQQIQQEHAERLARLERRQDEDARVKSVWGASSPFPSVLSGTPQQAPLQQPSADHFGDFDEEANTLMTSLHLDAEDEPRRGLGAASRANSVRFDETANQNHFAPSHRNSSVDLFSRASSGLGGLHMNERSVSHKSEGRASSAHSMRSAASGRANSLNLDSGYSVGDSSRSPLDMPGFAPGLLLLGSVPAIIRCWMNTNFKHDALLYAAVCTGSFKSYLDLRLIQKLGFEESIETDAEGQRTVKLPVYFPEAVPHPASSRSSSPAPQLPTLTVEFQVVGNASLEGDKAIQIFLGSDTMRAHSADILFSSNSITLFDDDRSKLSIPLVRPEDEATFKTLRITSGVAPVSQPSRDVVEPEAKEQAYLNGLGQGDSGASVSSATTSPPPGKYRPPGAIATDSTPTEQVKSGNSIADSDTRPTSRQSSASRPSLSILNTRSEAQEQTIESAPQRTPSRSGSGTAIWGSWRRDAAPSSSATTPQTSSSGLDWAGASKNRETQYQRRETGIKVLKPKSSSRAVSTSVTPSSASALIPPLAGSATTDGKSRFFDEGRRRSDMQPQQQQPAISSEKRENMPLHSPPSNSSAKDAPASAGSAKPKSNPIGGGSAFSWLNTGGH